MGSEGCNGTHRFYVAADGAVGDTGTVWVIVVCTACGEAMKKEFKVAAPNSGISLSDSNKTKGE